MDCTLPVDHHFLAIRHRDCCVTRARKWILSLEYTFLPLHSKSVVLGSHCVLHLARRLLCSPRAGHSLGLLDAAQRTCADDHLSIQAHLHCAIHSDTAWFKS